VRRNSSCGLLAMIIGMIPMANNEGRFAGAIGNGITAHREVGGRKNSALFWQAVPLTKL
jgi:hypothetical protein